MIKQMAVHARSRPPNEFAMRLADLVLVSALQSSLRHIHARSWQTGAAARSRKLDRPLDCFRSPGQGPNEKSRDVSRFVMLPTNQKETDGRTAVTSAQRALMQLCRSSSELIGHLRSAIAAGRADASVFGAAMQRCGQSSWWDALLEVRRAQRQAGVTLWPLQRNICLTALSRCVRSAGDGSAAVPSRQRELVSLGREVWDEVGPATDSDTFKSGLGAALRICAVADGVAGLDWAEELWTWAQQQRFPLEAISYSNYALVLEVHNQPRRVDELLSACAQKNWRPSVVLLGALVNAAAERHDWLRAEMLWDRLVNGFGVKPNLIAYSARAKAHLLCGRPALVASIIDDALDRNVELNLHLAEALLQASLVMYHSSLAAEDLMRLRNALSMARPVMCNYGRAQRERWQRLEEAASRIRCSPASVRLYDVLLTMHGRQSIMTDWPHMSAGSRYLEQAAAGHQRTDSTLCRN
mmetsp:Transcript_149131/g.415652  ORF Transcript_149131/g.415652 Transcript_149131/m.415652 type:complete len:468 (+) Transcript_149131:59-1462(+)